MAVSFDEFEADFVSDVKTEAQLLEEIKGLRAQLETLKAEGDIEDQYLKAEDFVLRLERKKGASQKEIKDAEAKIEIIFANIFAIKEIEGKLKGLMGRVKRLQAQPVLE